jgi:xanthine/uracil/vitamin C permease (AzgA family)
LPKKHEPSLSVELQPSRRLKQLLVIMHLLALASSIANALPVIVKLALVIGIGLHLYFVLTRLKNDQYAIKHSETSGWEIASDNDFKPIQILNSTVITLFAIFLHFNKNAHKQSVLIVNDALNEDDYRRLIVRLKTASKER